MPGARIRRGGEAAIAESASQAFYRKPVRVALHTSRRLYLVAVSRVPVGAGSLPYPAGVVKKRH